VENCSRVKIDMIFFAGLIFEFITKVKNTFAVEEANYALLSLAY